MTTHDEHTDIESRPAEPRATARPESVSAQTQPADPSVAVDNPPTATRQDPAAAAEPSTGASLFADGDRTGLRSRWDELQAAFVDDPKQCVEKADDLVSEVVDQLTNSFSEARSRLESQWARGEDASTEDLRVALKRYRDFFQRLLSV